MSGFSHYEGDQSALYSGSHHLDKNSEESKSLVKRIWSVTILLSIITIVEVSLGLLASSMGMSVMFRNILFIIGTIAKAYYIVKVFMHLGDEIKNMWMTIVVPLTLFIWFIVAFLADGDFWKFINHNDFSTKRPTIESQLNPKK